MARAHIIACALGNRALHFFTRCTLAPFLFSLLMAAALMRSALSAAVPSSLAHRVEGAFLAALMADSLSLGGHYEYDARKIRASGGYRNYAPPGEANNGIGASGTP